MGERSEDRSRIRKVGNAEMKRQTLEITGRKAYVGDVQQTLQVRYFTQSRGFRRKVAIYNLSNTARKRNLGNVKRAEILLPPSNEG